MYYLKFIAYKIMIMLCVLPPKLKPVNNLICRKTGLTWVVKHATLLFNLFCSNVARQVARFLSPIFTHLKLRGHYKRLYIVIRYLYKIQDGV